MRGALLHSRSDEAGTGDLNEPAQPLRVRAGIGLNAKIAKGSKGEKTERRGRKDHAEAQRRGLGWGCPCARRSRAVRRNTVDAGCPASVRRRRMKLEREIWKNLFGPANQSMAPYYLLSLPSTPPTVCKPSK